MDDDDTGLRLSWLYNLYLFLILAFLPFHSHCSSYLCQLCLWCGWITCIHFPFIGQVSHSLKNIVLYLCKHPTGPCCVTVGNMAIQIR